MAIEETEIVERLVANEERCKSNTHQIIELKDRVGKVEDSQKLLYEMNSNIKLIAQQNTTQNETIKTIKDDVGNLKSDVEDLKIAPLREQDEVFKKVKWLVISTVIGGVFGYFVNLIL